jgi:hypothetical protein
MKQPEKVRIYNFFYPVGVPIRGRRGGSRTIVTVSDKFGDGGVNVHYRREGEEQVRTCWCNTWVDWAEPAAREPVP